MMASFSISAKEAGAEITKMPLPNWLELPREIIENILKRLSTIDIVTSACLVCPLWWNIFKDPLMWRTIRMNNLCDCPRYFNVKSAYRDLDLLDIFYYAVQQSCGNLVVVDIEHFVTDDLLRYIAKNARNLRCMRCWSLSDAVFRCTVKKLPYLEELNISLMSLSRNFLEVLSQSCTLLKSLKFVMADPLYQGRNFNNRDDEVGWLAILDRCRLLDSLDIYECPNLVLNEDLRKRFQEQIKDLQLPSSLSESLRKRIQQQIKYSYDNTYTYTYLEQLSVLNYDSTSEYVYYSTSEYGYDSISDYGYDYKVNDL